MTDDARAIYEAAVRRVQADRLLTDVDWQTWARRPLDAYRRVVVAGLGKASMAMAGVVEAMLEDRLDEGAAVVPHGAPATLPPSLPKPQRVEILGAGHPLPDEGSQRAARRLLALAGSCMEEDLLLVLISGGGTSLCNDFFVPLEDAQRTYEKLLGAGADIHAMNTVRKHLSRFGGGRLARAAHPAEVLALVVSDVVGDDLSVIASGPTVPDPSTFDDAQAVLRAFDLWEGVPESVRRHLTEAADETPKADDPVFAKTTTRLIGTNRLALEAARREAEARGYHATLIADDVTGEAREVGPQLVRQALEAAGDAPRCLLWGGETTVTLRGDGKGGRNMEMALAAALALDGVEREACEIVFLSGGTDGIDGPTDAAGAWATPRTAARARQLGLDPQQHLAANDSYPFFDRLGQLLRPGPTHTNVMDVQVALVVS